MEPKTGSGEFENGQVLFNAYAASRRNLDEMQRSQKMMAELTGNLESYSPPPPGFNELIAATTAYQLVDLIDGYPPRTLEQYFEEGLNGISDGALKEIVFDDIEGEIDYEAFRAMLSSILVSVKDFAGIQEIDPDKTLHLYRKAEELSKTKNGTSIEDIFKDDQLYEELVGEAYAPEEFAAGVLDVVERFTPESVEVLLYNNMLAAMEFAASMEDDALTEEELQDIEEIRNSAAYKEQVVIQHRKLMRAYGGIIKAELERFWGQDAVAQIPEEIAGRIEALGYPPEWRLREIKIGDVAIHTLGATEDEGDILQKRAAFVDRYCAEKGLSVGSLSLDQILAIRELPEWKNPS